MHLVSNLLVLLFLLCKLVLLVSVKLLVLCCVLDPLVEGFLLLLLSKLLGIDHALSDLHLALGLHMGSSCVVSNGLGLVNLSLGQVLGVGELLSCGDSWLLDLWLELLVLLLEGVLHLGFSLSLILLELLHGCCLGLLLCLGAEVLDVLLGDLGLWLVEERFVTLQELFILGSLFISHLGIALWIFDLHCISDLDRLCCCLSVLGSGSFDSSLHSCTWDWCNWLEVMGLSSDLLGSCLQLLELVVDSLLLGSCVAGLNLVLLGVDGLESVVSTCDGHIDWVSLLDDLADHLLGF